METRTVKLPNPRTNTSRLVMPADAWVPGMFGPRTALRVHTYDTAMEEAHITF